MVLEFKKYRRTNISEMRSLEVHENQLVLKVNEVSVSEVDMNLPINEFMKGKIARNPNNYSDQWYVAKEYFEDNFEELENEA